MDLQLQQMYSCEVVGKGVCITRMVQAENNVAIEFRVNLINFGHFNLHIWPCQSHIYKTGKTAEV